MLFRTLAFLALVFAIVALVSLLVLHYHNNKIDWSDTNIEQYESAITPCRLLPDEPTPTETNLEALSDDQRVRLSLNGHIEVRSLLKTGSDLFETLGYMPLNRIESISLANRSLPSRRSAVYPQANNSSLLPNENLSLWIDMECFKFRIDLNTSTQYKQSIESVNGEKPTYVHYSSLAKAILNFRKPIDWPEEPVRLSHYTDFNQRMLYMEGHPGENVHLPDVFGALPPAIPREAEKFELFREKSMYNDEQSQTRIKDKYLDDDRTSSQQMECDFSVGNSKFAPQLDSQQHYSCNKSQTFHCVTNPDQTIVTMASSNRKDKKKENNIGSTEKVELQIVMQLKYFELEYNRSPWSEINISNANMVNPWAYSTIKGKLKFCRPLYNIFVYDSH